MEAGDRWLASRWAEFTVADVEDTARTMLDLFKRLGAPPQLLTGASVAETTQAGAKRRGVRKKKDDT
jgi:hypothetical protein